MSSYLVKFEGPSLSANQRGALERANMPIVIESGASWEGDDVELTSHTVKVEADSPEAAEAAVRDANSDYPFGEFEVQSYPSAVGA